jgi:hypothetical protein
VQPVTLEAIQTMARNVRGEIARIFLHWTAGHYGQPFPDYHLNIDADGTIYASTENLAEIKAHTWRNNSAAVAVSLCCGFNALCWADGRIDFGPEPPTEVQIETAAQVVAALCQGLGLPPVYNYVRTHAEQADMDSYGPATTFERWDLWGLPGVPVGQGGEILRAKVAGYMGQSGGAV